MSEPTGSPLWDAIVKIYNPWPLDDETVAAEVATAWRGGGSVLEEGAKQTGLAGEASLAAWTDPVGVDYGGQVAALAAKTAEYQQSMAGRAAHADYYGAELTSAKTSIHDTVAQNEQAFALLANPLLGPVGPALQTGFAAGVLGSMVGMIAQKAAAIRGNPAPPDPDPYDRPGARGPLPDPPARPAKISRELNPQETIDASEIFGTAVKLGDVTITDSGLFSMPGNTAVTINNTIYFPPGTLSKNTDTPEFQAWLMHELTHVWQYQHNAGIADLGWVSATGDYGYGGPQALKDAVAAGKPFQDFNTEQQAEIVAQYYYGGETGRDWRGLPGPYDPAPYKHYVDMAFPKK